MKLIKFENDKLDIQLTGKEISLLSKALNEVCNGIGGISFEKQIGGSRQEVSILLTSIIEVIDKMDSIYKAAETRAMPSKTHLLESKNKCYLQADGFRVIFYLKSFSFPKDTKNIGIFVVLLTETGSVEFNINSNPKPICLEDLWNFVINLENYIESVKNTQSPFPFFRSSNHIFQVLIFADTYSSKNPYLIINFMLQITSMKPKNMNHCMGTQAEVSIENLRNFTTSFRQLLNELS